MNEHGNLIFQVKAPGRVNLLGEHVDYNQGIVLPVAINRRITLEARSQRDRLVSLQALNLRQSTTFHLDHLDEKKDLGGNPLPTWALYPAGVAHELLAHGYQPGGIDALFTSDLPMGAGLSSSAALEVAFASLWQRLGDWEMSPLDIARLCQQAENRYVGVHCGLMDQFASVCGVAGHVLVFDLRNLEYYSLPLPSGMVIVVADSQIRRRLASSAYNERRTACEEAVRLLKPKLPHIQALRDVTPEELNFYSGLLPDVVFRRARHVVEECQRVQEAVTCLTAGDAAGFGSLMFECHASLRDLYEVSCPELDLLVDIAHRIEGCWGARLTGAGFGGSTVNLVSEDYADGFCEILSKQYYQATGLYADTILCRASHGVEVQVIDDNNDA